MILIYVSFLLYTIYRMTKEVRKKQYKWALESLVFAFLFVIEIAAWIILEIN